MTTDYTAARYLPISWEQIYRDSRLLAAKLMDLELKGIIAVSRGGLVPAAIIARELELRDVDTICVASYEDRTQGKARVLKSPQGDGEGYVVVDDLVDSGKTAQVIRSMFPKAHFAVLYAKPIAQQMVDSYVVPVDQDVWLLFPWEAEMQPTTPLVYRKSEAAKKV